MRDPFKFGDTPNGRPVLSPPPQLNVRPTSAEESDLIRRRQRSGARIMGVLLGGLVLLIFLITIAKQT